MFRREWCALIAAVVAVPIVASAAQAITYSQAVLADNPEAYWRLNETAGATAVDVTGHGHDGTYTGGVTLGTAGAFAESGGAASFDGLNDFVSIPGTWGGVGWPEVTVEAWANVGALSASFEAIVSSTDLPLSFVHLQLFNTGNNVVYTNVVPSAVTLPIVSQTPLNTWRHFAIVGKSGASALYVDGALVGSNTTSFANIVAATTGIRIGSGFGNARFFDGLIDEVAIYKTALTEGQIDAHIAAAVAIVPEPGSAALLALGALAAATLRRR